MSERVNNQRLESPEEFRQHVDRVDNKFYEDCEKRAAPFRGRALEYEKLAVSYTDKGFQTLTYLNGGALVAIPTAMAFFKTDVARVDVMWTGMAFIIGLLFVVIAQIAAFFTMAKRSEAQEFGVHVQFNRVAALMFEPGAAAQKERMDSAAADEAEGKERLRRSNVWRQIGLVFFTASLLTFIVGCALGAKTIVLAKEKTSPVETTK